MNDKFPCVFLLIVFSSINGVVLEDTTTDIEVKSVSNCTVDDLHKINENFESILSQNIDSEPTKEYFFSDCDINIVPDAIFTDVLKLRAIHFQRTNISLLKPSALDGLFDLEELIIAENSNLTKLQSWTTQNLVKLNKIMLPNNGLEKLEMFALKRYPQLIALNLSNNRISRIPIGFFDFSLNLEVLDLTRNLIDRLESIVFKALFRLTHLNLAFNQIKYIDAYTLTTTAHLRSLQLNGNSISSLHTMVFFNLAQLEYLNLSENAIKDIDDYTFQQNIHLTHLDISFNLLDTIQSNALKGLELLQVCTT